MLPPPHLTKLAPRAPATTSAVDDNLQVTTRWCWIDAAPQRYSRILPSVDGGVCAWPLLHSACMVMLHARSVLSGSQALYICSVVMRGDDRRISS